MLDQGLPYHQRTIPISFDATTVQRESGEADSSFIQGEESRIRLPTPRVPGITVRRLNSGVKTLVIGRIDLVLGGGEALNLLQRPVDHRFRSLRLGLEALGHGAAAPLLSLLETFLVAAQQCLALRLGTGGLDVGRRSQLVAVRALLHRERDVVPTE
jgi:hypothetical protein